MGHPCDAVGHVQYLELRLFEEARSRGAQPGRRVAKHPQRLGASEPFPTDDTYRALDSIHRLLSAMSAEQAAEVERSKQELLRVQYDEQARTETRKAAVAPTEGQPERGLKPWREIIIPHPAVASGRFQQAEFATDSGQVHGGEGSDEYRNPRDLFRRTFITHGLGRLLVGANVRVLEPPA
jgi:hypothetical protein